MEATARKEEIQRFIEDQIELGEEGLEEKDHYLLEVNLEDLEQRLEKNSIIGYSTFRLLGVNAR